MDSTFFSLWQAYSNAPYHFPATEADWSASMYQDTDSDGRRLFSELITDSSAHGLIQYGTTAFGFDAKGEISEYISHKVIRILCFDPAYPEEGAMLLEKALSYLGSEQRIHAFFHYFGMSVCARHGKLHESEAHVEALLLQNGFTVEHENVYYSRTLSGCEGVNDMVELRWKSLSEGGCREFAAVKDGKEVGWGLVHFLPQSEIAYLRWIYIDQARQHQGLGTAVMEALFGALYAMGVRRFDTDTALQNTAAQGYYEKTGFTNRGISRSYFTQV